MPEESPLTVTERTRHHRLREQGSTDRADLAAILAAGVICHLGVVVDGYPMVVPTVYGLDGDTLYLHGSVASRSLVSAPQATVCVTVTHVDGLVLARSVFEHAGQLPQRDDLRHAPAGDGPGGEAGRAARPRPSTSCPASGTTPAARTRRNWPRPRCSPWAWPRRR